MARERDADLGAICLRVLNDTGIVFGRPEKIAAARLLHTHHLINHWAAGEEVDGMLHGAVGEAVPLGTVALVDVGWVNVYADLARSVEVAVDDVIAKQDSGSTATLLARLAHAAKVLSRVPQLRHRLLSTATGETD